MEVLNNLRGLLNVKRSATPQSTTPSQINPDAGAELLDHFLKQWQELHQNNETNADLAGHAAELIDHIHQHMLTQNERISNINQLLASLPVLHNSMQTCNTQIQQLCKSFQQIEEDLIQFEDIIEQQEHEQKKNNHRFQLASYEEKKLASIQVLRSDLAKQHEQILFEIEQKKKEVMEERQHVFQDAFKTDLETYKALGTIPKIQVNQSSALLEEIQLDIDDKELMDFLDEK